MLRQQVHCGNCKICLDVKNFNFWQQAMGKGRKVGKCKKSECGDKNGSGLGGVGKDGEFHKFAVTLGRFQN